MRDCPAAQWVLGRHRAIVGEKTGRHRGMRLVRAGRDTGRSVRLVIFACGCGSIEDNCHPAT